MASTSVKVEMTPGFWVRSVMRLCVDRAAGKLDEHGHRLAEESLQQLIQIVQDAVDVGMVAGLTESEPPRIAARDIDAFFGWVEDEIANGRAGDGEAGDLIRAGMVRLHALAVEARGDT